MGHLRPRQLRAGAPFPTDTFLFPSAEILEGCFPDGIVQDGVRSFHPHLTEKCERNNVSVKTLTSWGLWIVKLIYLVITLA